MKLNVLLDENNYIKKWAVVGNFPNGIEIVIPDGYDLTKIEYCKYEDGVLTYDETKDQDVKFREALLQEQVEITEFLSATDYRAIKYAEGLYTEEEYAVYKQERQDARDRYNTIEELLIN